MRSLKSRCSRELACDEVTERPVSPPKSVAVPTSSDSGHRPRERASLDGIGSSVSSEVEDWSESRSEAERKLRKILDDAPDLGVVLYVVAIEFELSQN